MKLRRNHALFADLCTAAAERWFTRCGASGRWAFSKSTIRIILVAFVSSVPMLRCGSCSIARS